MIRLSLALAAALMAGACGPTPTAAPPATGPVTDGSFPLPPTGAASPATTVEPPPPVGATVRAYLVLGLGRGIGLVPVLRAVDPASAGPEAALDALLAGPNELEGAARPAVHSAIPAGTRVLGLAVDGEVATVDLSADFEAATEDGLPTAMRVAQVVYTLTQFPEIESVRIAIDGGVVTALGPDRFPIDGPLGRLDLTDQLPPLFVDDPAYGATISSPVRIAGLANAFEATFQIRIADVAGRGLATGPVTATCGTGCWGEFDVLVPFSVSAAGPGVVQAFELSARDGQMDNLREYPVLLTP